MSDTDEDKPMKVFAASNFVLLRYINKEQQFRQHIIDLYGCCGRLYSYFFQKEIQKVLQLMEGSYYEDKRDPDNSKSTSSSNDE